MSSTLMSIGMRAMFANNASLTATGHNIANANVAGYSRQTVALETAGGQFTGAGFFGRGVNVVNVTRAHDRFLTMQAAAARSLASADQTRYSQLGQLEDIFPPGEQGLGYAMGDFFAAMVDLGNSPADSSARQAVLARAADVADRFANAADRLDILQAGVRSDMTDSAKQVTALAAQVADLNHRIATYRGQDQQPNDLLDQRDELISQIGEYIDITTIAAPDGSMNLFAAGGQRLVLGAESASLTVSASATDPSRIALAISSNGVSIDLSTDMLTGGSMSGLLKFQNEDLVAARNQLGQMAAAFASKVNDAQRMGVDLADRSGADLSDIFKLGPAQALPSASNARDGGGNLLAQVGITRTDASLLQASDYTLRPDPANPGQYLVTRESDGDVFGPLTPDGSGNLTLAPDQGFSIQIGNPPPAVGDSFLLQPVARAASGMSRALDDPSGLAAALPVEATLGLENTGTASVDLLRMTDGSVDRDLEVTITFEPGGTYGYVMRDAGGSVVASGTGQPYQSGQEISLNGFALTLNGVPAEGDTLTVGRTEHPATNNGNALALSRLADEPLVGQSVANDGTRLGGATVTDAYADTMSNIGVRVQSAGVASNISAAAFQQVGDTLANKTGVNLDEEAARLIQFQQGYQAAAKVLQVAQSVFDTMLQIGR